MSELAELGEIAKASWNPKLSIFQDLTGRKTLERARKGLKIADDKVAANKVAPHLDEQAAAKKVYNKALLRRGASLTGIVAAPAAGGYYYANRRNQGAQYGPQ